MNENLLVPFPHHSRNWSNSSNDLLLDYTHRNTAHNVTGKQAIK